MIKLNHKFRYPFLLQRTKPCWLLCIDLCVLPCTQPSSSFYLHLRLVLLSSSHFVILCLMGDVIKNASRFMFDQLHRPKLNKMQNWCIYSDTTHKKISVQSGGVGWSIYLQLSDYTNIISHSHSDTLRLKQSINSCVYGHLSKIIF